MFRKATHSIEEKITCQEIVINITTTVIEQRRVTSNIRFLSKALI
jgi:hypothetical protein